MDKKGNDPFTSSREGIVEGDKNFAALLKYLKEKALPKIFDTWDDLRLKRGEEGDEENSRKSKKQRKARDLYAIASGEYSPDAGSPRRERMTQSMVGSTNFEMMPSSISQLTSTVSCRKILLAVILPSGRSHWSERASNGRLTSGELPESTKKTKANLSYGIRKSDKDIDYLGMDALAVTVEGKKLTLESSRSRLTRSSMRL